MVLDCSHGFEFCSVGTTGIYCRPSCAARAPCPENVAFHATALVADPCRLIDHAERAPSLRELAEHAGLSTHHLHRVFKTVTGLTPGVCAANALVVAIPCYRVVRSDGGLLG